MMSFSRAPILRVASITSFGVCLSVLAWAQHPVAAPVHPVAPAHVYAPPAYHAPVISPPIQRPPIMYAPNPAPLHNVPYAGGYRSSIVVPPVRPIHPIRRPPPLFIIYNQPFFFGQPFWQNSFCWDVECNWFWPLVPDYATISSSAPSNYVAQPPEIQVYVYGDEREDRPQLYLKDGTILNVTDYWVVDNQLHFKVIDDSSAKPVEQVIPFEELDLQKTVDANARRGFRFLLRNEPFDEYVRDHPDGPPPAVAPHQ